MKRKARLIIEGLAVAYICTVISSILLYILNIDYTTIFMQMDEVGGLILLNKLIKLRKLLAVFCISVGIVIYFYYPQAKKAIISISSVIILLGLSLLIYTDRFYDEQLSKIRFSEICPNNDSIELGDTGEYPDYIELYNDSDYGIKLEDLQLTVNGRKEVPFNDTIIPPGGYAVVMAEEGGFPETIDTNLGSNGVELAIVSPAGTIIDDIIVPELKGDQVYASVEDGLGAQWEVMIATPGRENNGSQSPEPCFSAESGFYDKEFDLELSAPEGCEIYYTTDGSIPTVASTKYTAPITIRNRNNDPNVYRSIKNVITLWNAPKNAVTREFPTVDKCAVIRAIACREGEEPSDVVTRSYFVGLKKYESTPVVSIVAHPDELFGDNGIYVTGKEYDDWLLGGQIGEAPLPSYRYKREIEAYFDYYDGEIFSGQNVGLRLQGASALDSVDKRFSIYARQQYSGSSILDYYFFGYPNHSIMLRMDDTDLICQDLIASTNTSVDTLPGYKAAVFLDGEFWYWTFIRPKYSRQHISWEHDVAKEAVSVSYGMPADIYDYLDSHPDLTDTDNYTGLCSIVDIDNYIDYIASNIYLCNMDMNEGKNLRAWKTEDRSASEFADGRWRFLAYDLDCISWARVPGKTISHTYEIDSFSEQRLFAGAPYDEDRVFATLKSNPEFCRKFVTRFLDLANSRFSAKEAIEILEKYGYNNDWMDSFLIYRLDYMAPALAKSFGLKGRLTDLCIQLKDPTMGKVRVNTIEPDMTDGMWDGRYYTDYSEDLLAIPEDGYEFVCWKNEKSGRIISTSEKLTVDWEARGFDKSENVVLEAVFQEVKE